MEYSRFIFHRNICHDIFIDFFKRWPSILRCDSRSVCKCLDQQAELNGWYECIKHNTSSFTSAAIFNSTSSDDFFSGISASITLIGVVSAIAMVGILYLSVMIARKRRQNKIYAQLEESIVVYEEKRDRQVNLQIKQLIEMQQTAEDYALLAPYRVPRDHVELTQCIASGAMGEIYTAKCRGIQ